MQDKLGRTPLDMVGDQPAATGGKVTEILSGGEQDLSSPNSLSENDRIVVCSMKLREAVSKWDQYK